jgi:hypothetical protein
MNRTLLLLVLYLFIANPILAQELFAPAGVKPQLNAVPASSRLKIDGRLNESDWQTAPVATSFTQVEPNQGRASQVKTEIRLLYTEQTLTIGVICFEPEGKKALRAPDLKRDFSWRAHDTFAICFDGFNDNRNSISFAVNPYETQKDYLSFDDTFFDSDWNGLWKVRTQRTDSAWTAEIEIPWKTFRYPSQADSIRSWGVNFLRLRRVANEISVWSPYPRSFGFSRMEYAGRLNNLRTPPPGANVQVIPYALTSFHRNQPATGDRSQSNGYKLGGEVKWAVNANNILEATFNTDFAQADADIRVNNISRFSVFFPERRQFFLENASLFGSGLSPSDGVGGRMIFLPFFSRTIGLANGAPMPLDGGARWVHRSAKENYGMIATRQREMDENPLTHFGVARYSRNIGKQNRLGALVTVKDTDKTNNLNHTTNVVAGMDGFFRFNKANSLTGMVLRSGTNGDAGGFGGYGQYLHTTNKIQAWWTETIVTKNFKPEMGFASRYDVVATTPGVFASLRGPLLPMKKIIRAYRPGATAEWYHRASTKKLVEREIKIFPLWVDFQSGAYVNMSLSHVDQKLDAVFAPLGVSIQPGSYNYNRQTISAGTDLSRKLSATLQHEWGSYFDGNLATTDLSVGVAPLPHISVKVGLNRNQFSGMGEQKVNRNIYLYTLESRLAWSPRLQLISLYQRNTQNNLDAYNIRLAWEYRPLSYVYVVFNNRAFDDLTGRSKEQTGILKVSYLKQF